MKGKVIVLLAGFIVGVVFAVAVGCLKLRSPEVVVREPEVPGEATIEYTPPGPPEIPAELVTNYMPMIQRMLNPKVEKVTDHVYVAMGYALGNIIMIITDEGLVIIDSSDNQEVAATMMKDFRKITDKPVRYLVYTHFHPDHTNGSRSIYEPGVEVIATEQFLYWIDYQNNLLGKHHQRSRSNQSGNAAPEYAFEIPVIGRSPVQVDRVKKPDVVMPTITFKDKYSFRLGNKRFELFHAPGETEDQLAMWMPEERILFPGDDYYHSFPNLSTPMLESRPVQGWIDSLNKFLELDAKIMVPQHTWPIRGEEVVREHLVNYRDAVKYVHDNTVRCINEGKTVHQAVAEVRLPKRLAELPYLKENYGRVDWSVRGIYHGYKGWYDGKGTSLYPLPPSHRARETVRLAGGANNILARAIELQKNGEHQLCMELCDIVLEANPHDRLANRIKAESAHQQAYVYKNLNTFGFFRSAYSLHMKAANE